MKSYKLTSIIKSLPASIPFVSPEEQERDVGQQFLARIGANENGYGPSPKVLEAIINASNDVWKYPDPMAIPFSKLVRLPEYFSGLDIRSSPRRFSYDIPKTSKPVLRSPDVAMI